MLNTIILLFVLGAFAGFFILAAVLKNKPTPKPVVLLHGALVGIALLVLLTYVVSGHTSTLLISSLVLFVLAALGGFTMFAIDLSKKPIPKMIALFHPVLAIIALVLLVVYALQTL